jgi:hypothetical protein
MKSSTILEVLSIPVRDLVNVVIVGRRPKSRGKMEVKNDWVIYNHPRPGIDRSARAYGQNGVDFPRFPGDLYLAQIPLGSG